MLKQGEEQRLLEDVMHLTAGKAASVFESVNIKHFNHFSLSHISTNKLRVTFSS